MGKLRESASIRTVAQRLVCCGPPYSQHEGNRSASKRWPRWTRARSRCSSATHSKQEARAVEFDTKVEQGSLAYEPFSGLRVGRSICLAAMYVFSSCAWHTGCHFHITQTPLSIRRKPIPVYSASSANSLTRPCLVMCWAVRSSAIAALRLQLATSRCPPAASSRHQVRRDR